jgi:hypothetical protein
VFFLLGGSLAPQWRVAQEIEVAAVTAARYRATGHHELPAEA